MFCYSFLTHWILQSYEDRKLIPTFQAKKYQLEINGIYRRTTFIEVLLASLSLNLNKYIPTNDALLKKISWTPV